MKFILALVTSLALIGNVYAADDKEGPGKGEMKTVCHPKKDKAGKEVKDKNGKVVEECKQIKVRKKLEGTDIPAAKK
jgi:hypothetical protein